MRRLGGITLLYAVVAALAIAAPLSASQPGTSPEDPAAAPAPAAAAPAPAPEPAPAPAPPAEAPAAPQPAAPAAPARRHRRSGGPRGRAAGAARRRARARREGQAARHRRGFHWSHDQRLPVLARHRDRERGDTVTWSNNGPTGHSATANDGSFDTGILQKGSSGSHTFSQAGTFSYICTPHPFMKGTHGRAGRGLGQRRRHERRGRHLAGTTSTGSQADSGPALPSTGMDVGGMALLGPR